MRRERPALAPRRGQRGVTLIVALIMLVALGLLAAWAARDATTNLRVVGNAQSRQAATDAAQAAIERTISDGTFSRAPTELAKKPVPVDLDGDGNAEITVTFTPAPTCYRWRVVRLAELDPTVAGDRACMGSASAVNAGIEGAAGVTAGDSLCADSEWNVRAVAVDDVNGTTVAVNQGVALRDLVTEVLNACP